LKQITKKYAKSHFCFQTKIKVHFQTFTDSLLLMKNYIVPHRQQGIKNKKKFLQDTLRADVMYKK